MVPKRSIPARIRRGPDHPRDSRLIIIASEGRKSEKKYFDDLAVQVHNPRVKVHVLEKLDDRSSPEYVIQLLDGFQEKYALEDTDMLWLVVDVDRWGLKLSQIARECSQKSYFLSVSNPAFEIWLLLHIKDILEYTAAEREELLQNYKDDTTRTRLEREIIKIVGQYNKSNLNTAIFLPNLAQAIHRARSLDISPEHRWPNHLGTRAYLLAQIISGKI